MASSAMALVAMAISPSTAFISSVNSTLFWSANYAQHSQFTKHTTSIIDSDNAVVQWFTKYMKEITFVNLVHLSGYW